MYVCTHIYIYVHVHVHCSHKHVTEEHRMLNRALVCHANALTLPRTPAGLPSPYSTACPSPGWRIRWHPTKVRGNGSEHQGRLWSSSHLLQVKGNTTTCLTKPCRFPATAASAPAAAGLLDCSGAAINAQANLLSSAPSALTSELWQHRSRSKFPYSFGCRKPLEIHRHGAARQRCKLLTCCAKSQLQQERSAEEATERICSRPSLSTPFSTTSPCGSPGPSGSEEPSNWPQNSLAAA